MKLPVLLWVALPALVSGCLSAFRPTEATSDAAPAADVAPMADASGRPDAEGAGDAVRPPDADANPSAPPDATPHADAAPVPDAAAPPTPTCPAQHDGELRGLGLTSRNTARMNSPRFMHTSTLLADGRVLVTGGYQDDDARPATSAEIYDPATATWTFTSGPMRVARAGHTATLLADHRVLIVGGTDQRHSGGDGACLAEVEIYDPVADTWSEASPMAEPRCGHVAVGTNDGRVQVAGGYLPGLRELYWTGETYDPVEGHWRVTEGVPGKRAGSAALLLPNGDALVAGGIVCCVNGYANLRSTTIYDAATTRWYSGNPMLLTRSEAGLVQLDAGTLLISGGNTANQGDNSWHSVASVETYDLETRTWREIAPMVEARQSHETLVLPSGRVAAFGGFNSGGDWFDSVETYDPALGAWQLAGRMQRVRVYHEAVLLPCGSVLVTGGQLAPNVPTDTVEILEENP